MDIVSLIHKVLSGEANAEEKRYLKNWKARHQENENEFESIKLLWEHSRHNDHEGSDVEFREVWERIDLRIEQLVHKKKVSARRNKILSVIGPVIFAGLLIYILRIQYQTTTNLRFDNTTLENVIAALEKELDVNIQVSDKELLNCRFTGIFHGKSSPGDVIRTIAQAMDWEYDVIDSEKFALKGTRCSP